MSDFSYTSANRCAKASSVTIIARLAKSLSAIMGCFGVRATYSVRFSLLRCAHTNTMQTRIIVFHKQ